MAVSAIFVEFNYAMFYSSYILKMVKSQFYCIIIRRYFSRMQKEESSGRALGLDPCFRDGLCF